MSDGPADILVVEDDDDVRDSIVESLADEGYLLAAARNGREALDYLEGTTTLPRLILLDLMMPLMDGHEFRAAQLARSRLAKIPVVVLSAQAHLNRTGEELKAAAVHRKPVALATLLAVAQEFCGPPTRVARGA